MRIVIPQSFQSTRFFHIMCIEIFLRCFSFEKEDNFCKTFKEFWMIESVIFWHSIWVYFERALCRFERSISHRSKIMRKIIIYVEIISQNNLCAFGAMLLLPKCCTTIATENSPLRRSRATVSLCPITLLTAFSNCYDFQSLLVNPMVDIAFLIYIAAILCHRFLSFDILLLSLLPTRIFIPDFYFAVWQRFDRSAFTHPRDFFLHRLFPCANCNGSICRDSRDYFSPGFLFHFWIEA
jgi:hypothetical protein